MLQQKEKGQHKKFQFVINNFSQLYTRVTIHIPRDTLRVFSPHNSE